MEPFIGQIMMFGGNFAPRGWAFCDGQLLPISQNDALFSLLGTTYGGDGRTTFGLPDLRGRAPIHAGNGPGLTPRQLGERGGSETETLSVGQMPSHSHDVTVQGTSAAPNSDSPANAQMATLPTRGPNRPIYNQGGPSDTPMLSSPGTSNTGGSQPVNNMPPFQAVHYIISLQGIYPSRS